MEVDLTLSRGPYIDTDQEIRIYIRGRSLSTELPDVMR
jgi:hypothetical protein